MLDLRFIRENIEQVKDTLLKRGMQVAGQDAELMMAEMRGG